MLFTPRTRKMTRIADVAQDAKKKSDTRGDVILGVEPQPAGRGSFQGGNTKWQPDRL